MNISNIIAELSIGTWLIIGFIGFSGIDTHNKRIWQVASRGELPDGDEQPPQWMVIFRFLKYGFLIPIALADLW